MKNKVVLFAILALIILLSPRLFILTWAAWDYYHTDIVCTGRDPTPPTGLGEQVPLSLYEVKPYSVLTDVGYTYPGDEIIVNGEGWSGAADLLWAGKDGAVFLVTLRSSGHSQITCRWFTPAGDYR